MTQRFDDVMYAHDFVEAIEQARDQLLTLQHHAGSTTEYIDKLTVRVDARGPVACIEYHSDGHQIKMEVR